MRRMLLPILDHLNSKRIVLASSSPRRLAILENIGLNIEVIPSSFEENLSPSAFPSLQEFVIETAFQKAKMITEQFSKDMEGKSEKAPELIISADTIVAQDGTIFGKPHTEEKGREMLRMLSGKIHQVYTGVVLAWLHPNQYEHINFQMDRFCEVTRVKMSQLSDDIITSYLKTGEPLDKAGGYGIQGLGGTLVESIEGDFYTIVGFPLHKFCKKVSEHYKKVPV